MGSPDVMLEKSCLFWSTMEKAVKRFYAGKWVSHGHICAFEEHFDYNAERFEENYYWRMRVYLEDFHCHSAKRCGCLK